MKKSTETVLSVEKAADLLFCFSKESSELTINDFVGKTGMNRTTVFRLLNALKNKGLIVKDEHANTYQLSLSFIGFGQVVTDSLDVRKIALPVLKRLSALTNESVSLNYLQAYRRVCVEKVDGTEDIRHLVSLGYPYPLIRGASGKVLLAHCSKEFIEEAINEWEKDNSLTIERSELFEEIEAIKKRGYAISKSNRVVGAYAISAPILNSYQELVGGISISGLETRLTHEKEAEYIRQVINGCEEISANLGYKIHGRK